MRPLLPALLLATALSAAALPAAAGDPIGKHREQVVTSLSVTGTIDIDPQGKVLAYTIAQPEAYDPAVRGLIERSVPHWTFQPVLIDGTARTVSAAMFLRIAATPLPDGKFRIGIASAAFGKDDPGTMPSLDVKQVRPPRYPNDLNRAGIGGAVIAVVKVGRDGRVADAMAEQTNLYTLATEKAMARWRAGFEKAALEAVRSWHFTPPAKGGDAPYWSVRVPMVFTPGGAGDTGPFHVGKWDSYVPGPRHRVPWATDEELADTGIDALPGGGVFPLRQALHLLTPLHAG